MNLIKTTITAAALIGCLGMAGGITLFAAEYYTCGQKHCLFNF